MKTYKKNYIGKGTKVENLDIVQVSICITDAEQFFFEYDGKKYLKFEVAAMQQKTEYGKTHTAYISTREDAPEEAPQKPNSINEAAANKTGGREPLKKKTKK